MVERSPKRTPAKNITRFPPQLSPRKVSGNFSLPATEADGKIGC
jgi:hypothetical protein